MFILSMHLHLEYLILFITLKYFMLFRYFDALANIAAHFVKFVHRIIIVDHFIESKFNFKCWEFSILNNDE